MKLGMSRIFFLLNTQEWGGEENNILSVIWFMAGNGFD